jgi:LemA protein
MMPIIIVAILVFAAILFYNSLIAKKNQVDNIYASIDAVLKKRYNLIPNLVSTVSKYMNYERSVLDQITKLRMEANRPNLSDEKMIDIDKKLTQALGSIMVAVENYPELKSNENVIQLQQTLTEIEAQISAARRAYNQAVTDYNNALEMIPTNIIAKMLNYKAKSLFEISANQRQNIDINELFKAA